MDPSGPAIIFYEAELCFPTVTSAFLHENSNSEENLGKNNKAGLENQEICNIRTANLLEIKPLCLEQNSSSDS